MVSITRLKPSRLRNRLDAVYYHPDFLANEDRLLNSDVEIQPLKQFVKEGRRAIYFNTQTLEADEAPSNWVPFLTADDFGSDGFFIDLNSRRRVSPDFADQYPKGELRENELLVKVKGPNQVTAYNLHEPTQRVLVSGTIWGALVRKGKINPYYLVAVLSCPYAAIARSRLRTNTNVEFLAPDDLLNLELPIPQSLKAQKYVGDKVWWAEQFRNKSRTLENFARSKLEDTISWSKNLETRTLHRRVDTGFLEQRLDLNFNSPSRVRLLEYFTQSELKLSDLDELVEISAMIGWKGLTTDHYTNQGPWLLRGVEFSDGIIDFDNLVSIEQHKYDEQPQIHLDEGDIALTKDGTIGKAIVIPTLANELAAGSTVARLRLLPSQPINVHYLEFVLNHPVLQIQIFSFATGIAQPHITQEWIARLQIPRCGDVEELIGSYIKKHHQFQLLTSYLTLAAKFLVEALIEGRLSEDDLKAAQAGLEQGDTTLDREILSRLSRKGIDYPNEPPLFPNLDDLYTALSQLEEAETTEEGGTNNGQTPNVYTLNEQLALPLASETASGSYPTTQEVLG